MRAVLRVLLIMVMCTSVGFAKDNKSKDILFLSTPNVDKTVAQNCFDFMTKNIRGDMRADRTLLKVQGFKPEEQLKAFSAMRTKTDALVVVLVNDPYPKVPVVIYSEKLGAAVVNIGTILNDKGVSDKIKEARIERAAMYGLGRVAGMKACLNPFCALSNYPYRQKNKMPGRNYCPNCSDPMAKRLRDMGVTEKAGKLKR